MVGSEHNLLVGPRTFTVYTINAGPHNVSSDTYNVTRQPVVLISAWSLRDDDAVTVMVRFR